MCLNVLELFLQYFVVPITNIWITGHDHRVGYRWAMPPGNNARRYGAPRWAAMGDASQTALASSTIFAFKWEVLIFMGWNHNWHVVSAKEDDLLDFAVTMHPGTSKQYIQCHGLTASWLDLRFTSFPVHCDKKPSRTGLNLLSKTYICRKFIRCFIWVAITSGDGIYCKLCG